MNGFPAASLDRSRSGTLRSAGYNLQFEGNFKTVNVKPGGPRLIGRAVTCSFVPLRPEEAQTELFYTEGSEELERAGLRLELDEGSGKFELRKIGGESNSG